MKEIYKMIIAGIILFGVFGLMIYAFIGSDKEDTRFSECLKPYAEKVCEEKGLNYSSHLVSFWTNDDGIFCKKDLRESESQRFLFTSEEIILCRDFAKGGNQE